VAPGTTFNASVTGRWPSDMRLLLPDGMPSRTISTGVKAPTARGESLIVRVLRGRVRAGRLDLFRERAGPALGRVREHDGCVFAQVARQANGDGSADIVVVSAWASLDALYDWVGGTDLLDFTVVAGRLDDLLDHIDIQHYEAIDVVGEAASPAGELPEVPGQAAREALP